VDANSLGHDLTRGVAGFRRVWESTGKTAEEAAAAENGADGDGCADGAAALPAVAGGPVPVPANGSAADLSDGPADEEIFDDSAIEALAQDTASVATPF
jgi:hypothetical protein